MTGNSGEQTVDPQEPAAPTGPVYEVGAGVDPSEHAITEQQRRQLEREIEIER